MNPQPISDVETAEATTIKTDTAVDDSTVTSRELVWTVHPARENRVQAAAVAGIILLVPALLALAEAGTFLIAGGTVLLILSIGRYFVPTTVRMDQSGVSIRTPWRERSRPWSTFRSFRHDSDYLRLCTLSRPTRLDHYRGTLVQFRGNRDEVLRFVRNQIPSPEEAE